MQNYTIECECGGRIVVPETAAGARRECDCGRTLFVPSLHILREQAGLPPPGLSPEKTIETLLLAGRLPEDKRCVLCSSTTESTVYCTVDCARARVKSGDPSWWKYVLGYLLLGLGGIIAVYRGKDADREFGKDCIFDLPLRVCLECQAGLQSETTLKTTLMRIPVYRDLLEKYPKARITLLRR